MSSESAELILKGRFVTSQAVVKGQITISGGKITRFGGSRPTPISAEVIELPTRCLILPAVVDTHAHLRDLELSNKGDFQSESQSAAAGGVTFAIDMPNSRPPTLTRAAFEEKKARAKGRMAIDFGLNLGFRGNLEELPRIKGNFAFGEIFVGPSTEGPVVGYGDLEKALRVIALTGKIASIHAEDPAFFQDPGGSYDHGLARPPRAESECISRIIEMNRRIGARLHFCHVSTRDGLLAIVRAKSSGMAVTCEVTPHHLVLTSDAYQALGTHAKMNPPLRDPDDAKAMLEGIVSGSIDYLASDHAPHELEEKGRGEPDAPSGVPGFETLVPAVLTCFEEHGIPPTRFVELANCSPARIYKVPGKGFARGRDADLVVLDPGRRTVDPDSFLSKARYSPFSGMELKYWPIMTILRGKTIFKDGEITIKDRGSFLSPETAVDE